MADQAVVWIDAGGGTTTLRSGADTAIAEGVSGRFSPSMLILAERVPLQPGQRFRDVQHGVAEVQVPVEFYASASIALRTTMRTWAHRLDAKRGTGTLRVTAPAGDQRDLVCLYASGLEAAAEDDWSDRGRWIRAVLRFVTEQPYWTDASDIVQSWSLMSSLATFFPLFPLRLSGSEVFADATITNDGDVEAWPVWTITGPGSGLILRNLTTGKLFSLPITLLGGETVTVDTRPSVKTVTKQDGSSLFGQQATDGSSTLWPLLQGSNSVRLELTAATASSGIAMRYRRRYLST